MDLSLGTPGPCPGFILMPLPVNLSPPTAIYLVIYLQAPTHSNRRPHESLSSAGTQAATQQHQLHSPPAALFSVGFFRQRFGDYCPTSTCQWDVLTLCKRSACSLL
ncbi:unnamed protein product [Pleuronectes platessa]|uniref:Uncharacterized protein n=1 Tax=Pleuronectes platessa TaxID=8262 RepID=A0A9N7Y8X5_PLEPL|nr:unnamed protein product [Pleuronectes platessa]